MAGGLNTYAYVDGNPVNFIDPEGLNPLIISGLYMHWTRNNNNQTPSYKIAKAEWTKLDRVESIYHQMGSGNENNEKFVSPNGHNEVVYNENGCLVTDEANQGTYNYAGPRTLGGLPHVVLDVIPYMIFGNSPSDMFNMQRFETTGQDLGRRLYDAIH